jgi:pimeloyl-ACP methyl ester carboxylesterase
MPGFGGTKPLNNPSISMLTDWIAQKLQQLNLEDTVLVGHSMSGKLALSVATLYPELVTKVILVAPSPPTQEPMEEEERQRMLRHPDENEAKTTVNQSSNFELEAEKKQLAINNQLNVDHGTWRWWLLEGMNESITNTIHQISTPIFLLTSVDDPVISYDFLKKDFNTSIQDIKEFTIEKAGHLLPLENPDWIAEKIRTIVGTHHK